MRARRLAILSLVVALAACAGLPTGGSVPDYDLLGRLFVGQDGPSFSAHLRWSHVGGEDRIWLMTPLGQTLAYIEDTPRGATLTTADQQQYHAGSVEGLTRKGLGWALPLAELRHWVRGRAVPGLEAADVQTAADGTLLELKQAGWHVTFTAADTGRLPRRLTLTQGRQQIRLVIDEWRDPRDAQ